MAITCWVPGCTHNNLREECSFFRFPTNLTRLKRWLQLIKRDGKPGTGARLCSCHFRDKNKDNDPEIFKRNSQKLFKEHYLTPEKKEKRVKAKRKLNLSHNDFYYNMYYGDDVLTEINPEISFQDESMPGPSTREADKASSTVLTAENYLLKMELERATETIRTMRLHFSYLHIQENDSLILEYTGLPNRKIFDSLIFLLQDIEVNYYLKWKVEKLCMPDQILMTLMKLRQNFTHTDLAYRFSVSTATVTNIVVTFVHLFHEVLYKKLMNNIPTRSKNRSCLPNCASTFTNCRIILDCTEVFSAVPRQSMKHQKLTYSSYKHRNTLKALVGVAPNGVITYASNLYPGSTSDKMIVKSCGILNQMEPGDLILADKGFLIKDILPNGVTVNVPPFLSTAQFTPEQVRRTECIARARIHVERAIKRMKSYKILSFIPLQLFNYSSIIFKSISALTNLQCPLIKEVSQFYADSEVDK